MNYFSDTSGEEVYYDHEECGDTKGRLYIRYTGRGWVYICHNGGCDFRGFKPAREADVGKAYVLQLKKKQTPSQINDEEAISLPSDFTKELPNDVSKWIMSYGITEEELYNYGIGWSEYQGRLIFPIYENGILTGYQGRNFRSDGAKYLTTKRYKDKALLFEISRGPSKVVVVEDIVSAIKVGRFCSSMAILGSPNKISAGVMERLIPYEEVVMWLDPDKIKTSLKWSRALQLFGFNTRTIWADMDPKCFHDKFIAKKVGA